MYIGVGYDVGGGVGVGVGAGVDVGVGVGVDVGVGVGELFKIVPELVKVALEEIKPTEIGTSNRINDNIMKTQISVFLIFVNPISNRDMLYTQCMRVLFIKIQYR